MRLINIYKEYTMQLTHCWFRPIHHSPHITSITLTKHGAYMSLAQIDVPEPIHYTQKSNRPWYLHISCSNQYTAAHTSHTDLCNTPRDLHIPGSHQYTTAHTSHTDLCNTPRDLHIPGSNDVKTSLENDRRLKARPPYRSTPRLVHLITFTLDKG